MPERGQICQKGQFVGGKSSVSIRIDFPMEAELFLQWVRVASGGQVFSRLHVWAKLKSYRRAELIL